MDTTPRSRVMTALRGETPDKIPFTIYAGKLPMCATERNLRNRGLCVVERVRSYKLHQPNVKDEEYHFTDERGRRRIRNVYTTPYGELTTLSEWAGFTTWYHERMFKRPEDYRALRFMIEDTVAEEDYAAVAGLADNLGDDFVVRDNLLLEPLQMFISSNYIGMEDFCTEWMDNRDEILRLYEAQVELSRKIYPIAANSPLEFCNYGGNVVPQIIGEKTFRDYYIPNYNEAAEILHKKGKLIGSHLDADNSPIMEAVAETDLDYIEAYDAGMSPSVSEARKAWPGKVLWLNWPSAWHLHSSEDVYAGTLQLIREASPGDSFLIGITEDVPEDRWRGNFTTIIDAIDDSAEHASASDK